MFLCPRRLKVNKGEKYNHSRPLNYQNIKKRLSNLHVQIPHTLQVTALEFCSVRKLRTFSPVRKSSALSHVQLAGTRVYKDASNSSPRS